MSTDWFLPKSTFDRHCRICQSVGFDQADEVEALELGSQDATLLREALAKQIDQNRWLAEQLDRIHREVRIGSWSFSVGDIAIYLSDQVLSILESKTPLSSQLDLDTFAGLFLDKRRVEVALTTCAEHALAFNLTLELVTLRGNSRWVRLTGEAMLSDGRTAQVSGALQDVTDEHFKTLSLMESESRFRDMVSSLSDGFMLVTGSPLCIDFVSPSMAAIMDQDPSALQGMTLEAFRTFTHPEDYDRVVKRLQEAIQGKLTKIRYSHRFSSGNGSYRWFEDHVSFTYGPNGEVEKVYIVCRDTDAQVKVAQELAEAKEAAQLANRVKSDFLSSMSHELRTPMTGVLGMTELLLETELDEVQRDFAHTVFESGQNLLVLLNDILDFSRVEAGRMQIESFPSNIREMAEEVCRLMSAAAEKKGLALILDFDVSCPPIITVDATRLRQVLLNLIGNAIKFTSNGFVLVSFKAQRRLVDLEGKSNWDVSIQVRDSGIGIPLAEQKNLFDAFTQVTNVNHKAQPGTGLGLAICKRLIELMGGNIKVSSQLGKGSEFSIHLAARGPALALRAQLSRRYVLLIDPNPEESDAIVRYVTAMGLICVAVANEGEAYERLVTGFTPDTIIRSDFLYADPDHHTDAKFAEQMSLLDTQHVFLTNRTHLASSAYRELIPGECVLVRPLIGKELQRLFSMKQPAPS